MMPRTDAATTKDWLEGSERIEITSYVQSYVPTAVALEIPAIDPILDKSLLDTLVKSSMALRIEQRSPATQPELELEFQAWDSLSDEAFLNFEQELS
jgi:hypothetical protein